MKENLVPHRGSVISAMFLVGGTSIGGGMLALPVATGISGFFPSIVAMLLCWLAMTATALLLLEACLWMEEGAHVITIATRLMGVPGKVISWLLFLFISYCSIVAYTAGGGLQIAEALNAMFGWQLTKAVGCIIFILFFGFIVDLGTTLVGRINAVLFIAMITAYIALVGMGISEVKPDLLYHNQNWSYSLMAFPLLLTSFSFQTMVPSLTPYLKRHAKSLRLAIVGGTTIAFIVYLIWQWLILGIIPVHGTSGLAMALAKGEPATQYLRDIVQGPYISLVAEYFAFFALVTSFLGMALGLFDFLADGLSLRREGFHKLILAVLVTVPTLFFAIYYERAFLVALESSGGFGDSILNGIMPIIMVWIGRYYLGMKGDHLIPGGKSVLTILLIFFVGMLGLQILLTFGFIFSIHDIEQIFNMTGA